MKLFYNSSLSSFLFSRNKSFLKMKISKEIPILQCSDGVSHKRAADFLSRGQVIAIPTDTVYGLACSANCPDAIKKLYEIKGRDTGKPVAICVSSVSDIRKWGQAEHLPDKLLNILLPGPITIVLEKTKDLNNPYLNPTTTKIGLRIPNSAFINKMTKAFNKPIALTSANFSNEPSTLCIKEFQQLYGHLGAVFDGGTLSKGLEHNRTGSTVVDLSANGYYKIIRCGISCDGIVKVLKEHGLCTTK